MKHYFPSRLYLLANGGMCQPYPVPDGARSAESYKIADAAA
jgi:hypothetical protein